MVFVVHISGFRCVFTLTESKGKVYRHLSISNPQTTGRVVHPAAAQLVAELFGFTGQLTSWGVTIHRDPVLCVILLQEIPNEIPKQS